MGYLLPTYLARWQGLSLWKRCLITAAVLSLFIFSFILSTRDSNDVAKYVIKTPPKLQSPPPGPDGDKVNEAWEFVVERDGDDHGLSDEQCRAAFPKLYDEIDKSTEFRKQNKIKLKELNSIPVEDGMVRALIHHGEVCFLFTLSFCRLASNLIISHSYTLLNTEK